MHKKIVHHPVIGSIVKCRVIESRFDEVIVNIYEVEGNTLPILYRGILKPLAIDGNLMVSVDDVLKCTVIAYSDSGLNLAMCANEKV